MTTLARGCCVLFVLVVVAGLVGARPAWGEEPAKLDNPDSADVEEMAGALGFADSHAPGFWEALTPATRRSLRKAKARCRRHRSRPARRRCLRAVRRSSLRADSNR